MIKPNDSISRSLVALDGDPNWEEIVKWIDDSLAEQSITNNKLSGDDTIKGQGRCLELLDLLKHIGRANKYIENVRQAEKMNKLGGK